MTEVKKTAAKYLGPRYTQHNPNAADGPERLKGYIAFLKDKFPNSLPACRLHRRTILAILGT